MFSHIVQMLLTGSAGYAMASIIQWLSGRKKDKADITAVAVQISHEVMADLRVELANAKEEIKQLRQELAEARAELAKYREEKP